MPERGARIIGASIVTAGGVVCIGFADLADAIPNSYGGDSLLPGYIAAIGGLMALGIEWFSAKRFTARDKYAAARADHLDTDRTPPPLQTSDPSVDADQSA